jgi:hypothetical protein
MAESSSGDELRLVLLVGRQAAADVLQERLSNS